MLCDIGQRSFELGDHAVRLFLAEVLPERDSSPANFASKVSGPVYVSMWPKEVAQLLL